MTTTCYAYDLDEVDADLRARKLQTHPQLKDHRAVKAFVARLADPGRKKRAEGQSHKVIIRIVSVAAGMRQLRLLAQEFEKQTGLSLPPTERRCPVSYGGSSTSTSTGGDRASPRRSARSS